MLAPSVPWLDAQTVTSPQQLEDMRSHLVLLITVDLPIRRIRASTLDSSVFPVSGLKWLAWARFGVTSCTRCCCLSVCMIAYRKPRNVLMHRQKAYKRAARITRTRQSESRRIQDLA